MDLSYAESNQKKKKNNLTSRKDIMSILNLLSGGVIGLIKELIKPVSEWMRRKQELKEAINQNNIRMASSEQSHNQKWEIKSLENAGWKDEVLFFAIIGMYVYSAVYPEGAAVVFENWDTVIPVWFSKITMWMVGSILGVKKIGDYLPSAIAGIKAAFKN